MVETDGGEWRSWYSKSSEGSHIDVFLVSCRWDARAVSSALISLARR